MRVAGAYFGSETRRQAASGCSWVATRHAAADQLPWHHHDGLYLTLVVRGGYREETPEAVREVSAGAVLVHPEGERHHDRFGAAESVLVNVEPEAALVARLRAHLPRAFTQGAVLPPLAAAPLLAALLAEMRDGDDLTALVVEGELAELAARLARLAGASTGEPSWLRGVDERIADAPELSWTLDGLAAAAGVHPHYLAVAFRRHRGRSVGEAVRRHRLERASLLLSRGEAIADVALACGFCDQSHLTRWFSRQFAVSPGRYGRRLRALVARRDPAAPGAGREPRA